jgi:hypothetical protein
MMTKRGKILGCQRHWNSSTRCVSQRGVERVFFSRSAGAETSPVLESRGMTLRSRHGYPRFLLMLSACAACAFVTAGVAQANAEANAQPPAAPGAIVLTQGVTYRARLKLSFFQCLASRDRIEHKFGGGGFANVHVFMSARDLPSDWPAGFRSRSGSCERYAEGIWARPTMPRNRPASIESWWVAPGA